MTDQLPSKDVNGPPWTVDRYGSLAAAVVAERDWLRKRVADAEGELAIWRQCHRPPDRVERELASGPPPGDGHGA